MITDCDLSFHQWFWFNMTLEHAHLSLRQGNVVVHVFCQSRVISLLHYDWLICKRWWLCTLQVCSSSDISSTWCPPTVAPVLRPVSKRCYVRHTVYKHFHAHTHRRGQKLELGGADCGLKGWKSGSKTESGGRVSGEGQRALFPLATASGSTGSSPGGGRPLLPAGYATAHTNNMIHYFGSTAQLLCYAYLDGHS